MTAESALLNEINRSVGTLMERVDGLRADVAESRVESNEHRKLVSDRLQQTERRTTELEEAVIVRLDKLEALATATAERVAKIEPTIEAFNRLKQRGVGALSVVGIAATMIGGVLALKWDALAAWFSSWWAS